MIEVILQNELATALGATTVIGALMYLARELPVRIWKLAKRQFTVEIEVLSEDPAYGWLALWLSNHPYASTSRRLRLASVWRDEEDVHWSLSPGLGIHLIWQSGRPMLVNREERGEGGGAAALSREPKEKIILSTIGRSQDFLRGVVAEAKRQVTPEEGLTIHMWQGYWGRPTRKAARPLDTINLAEGQMERIVSDIARFIGSRDWYVERGIPYRRAYLFSGPPGTGKTTTIMALAAHFRRPLCVINLGAINGDDGLFSAISSAPGNAIILFEDIDCASASADRAVQKGKGPSDTKPEEAASMAVTKAGMLNALDGVTTPDGRIFMLTTNYPERLDAALLRPGRADVHERLDYLNSAEQRAMASRFYGRAYDGPVSSDTVSPAALQGAFMRYPDDPMAAFSEIAAMEEAA